MTLMSSGHLARQMHAPDQLAPETGRQDLPPSAQIAWRIALVVRMELTGGEENPAVE